MKTEKDRLSYSLGIDIASSLRSQAVDIDPDLFTQGIKDTFAGGKSLLTEEEFRATMATFQKSMMEKQANMQQQQGENNKTDGESFLAENKTKEGVVTLPSGLQYIVMEEGSGDSPKAADNVSVHYSGMLISGDKFDSSYDRGEPASFSVNGVIPGWTEALQLMKPGAKWQLFIPSDLAYGERGAGQQIGPHSALIFDVELISIG